MLSQAVASGELFTIGQISDALGGVDPQTVSYHVRRCKLREVRRAGIARMFSAEQVELIRQSLESVKRHTPPVAVTCGK